MKNIPNWGGNSNFNYEGSVKEGTIIHINGGGKVKITSQQYAKIIMHFHGKKESVGTSFDNPPKGSVGQFMIDKNMTRASYMTYIGAILVKEGYAYKDGSDIIFK